MISREYEYFKEMKIVEKITNLIQIDYVGSTADIDAHDLHSCCQRDVAGYRAGSVDRGACCAWQCNISRRICTVKGKPEIINAENSSSIVPYPINCSCHISRRGADLEIV